MSEPITDKEREELWDRTKRLHRLYNLGGAYYVENYTIDWVQNAGLWIYAHDKNGKQVYGDNVANEHADHADPDDARAVLDALRRQMVLEDLADV